MSKHNILICETVYFETTVEADTRAEAFEILQQQIDEGEDVTMVEVDNSPLEILETAQQTVA